MVATRPRHETCTGRRPKRHSTSHQRSTERSAPIGGLPESRQHLECGQHNRRLPAQHQRQHWRLATQESALPCPAAAFWALVHVCGPAVCPLRRAPHRVVATHLFTVWHGWCLPIRSATRQRQDGARARAACASVGCSNRAKAPAARRLGARARKAATGCMHQVQGSEAGQSRQAQGKAGGDIRNSVQHSFSLPLFSVSRREGTRAQRK
jgi:hypothetical protein